LFQIAELLATVGLEILEGSEGRIGVEEPSPNTANTPGKGHSIFGFLGQINNLSEDTYIFKNGQFIKVN